jgi:phage tail-like protein
MSDFSNYDSFGTFKFGLEIDGIMSKTIKSVDGLSLKLDKVETKSVGTLGKPIHKAWPGNKQYLGTLKATRVMTELDDWHLWYKQASGDVKLARKHGSVIIYSQDGNIMRQYNFKHAWPIELTITQMNASNAAAVEETITFVYEEIEIEK